MTFQALSQDRHHTLELDPSRPWEVILDQQTVSGPLRPLAFKSLLYLVEFHNTDVTYRQLAKDVWGIENASDDTIRKTLLEVGQTIGDDWLQRSSRAVVKFCCSSMDLDFKADALRDPEPFTLIVDGMIVDAVCELLKYDDSMIPVIHRAHRTYKRCLEDFAFALVYGTSIVSNSTVVDIDVDPRRHPRHWLLQQLGSLWRIHDPDPDLIRGALLKNQEHRRAISSSLEAVARCVVRDGWAFRDWMSGEITRHLGDAPTLFQTHCKPEYLEFRSPVMKHYTDHDLQHIPSGTAIDPIVEHLKAETAQLPQHYPDSTLKEFATRSVLALVTIMRENDVSARRRDMTRLPHLLRCLTQQELLKSTATPQQLALKSLTVQHALGFVLEHIEDINRESLIASLLNIRNIPPFDAIRGVLQDCGLFLANPRPIDEPKVAAIHRKLLHLVTRDRLIPDAVLAAENVALREMMQVRTTRYDYQLYRVFPALRSPAMTIGITGP